MTKYYNIEMIENTFILIRDYLLEQLTMLDSDEIIQLVHIIEDLEDQKLKQDIANDKALIEEIKEQKFFDILCQKYPDLEAEFKDLQVKFLKGELDEGDDE